MRELARLDTLDGPHVLLDRWLLTPWHGHRLGAVSVTVERPRWAMFTGRPFAPGPVVCVTVRGQVVDVARVLEDAQAMARAFARAVERQQPRHHGG